MSIKESIRRIRFYRISSGLAKSRLALIAGVPEGILRNMDDDSWNPTLSSLRKIEKIIPKDFEYIESKRRPKTSVESMSIGK